MTLWWCEYCHENHERATDCELNQGGGRYMTDKELKSYNRRMMAHAKHPPKSGCVVVLFVAAAVPAGIWWYFA